MQVAHAVGTDAHPIKILFNVNISEKQAVNWTRPATAHVYCLSDISAQSGDVWPSHYIVEFKNKPLDAGMDCVK